MQSEKRLLQKISSVSGVISFIAAIVAAIIIVIAGSEASDVFRASLGATTFFFFMVGIVLTTMGNTNLPNLTIDKTEQLNQEKGHEQNQEKSE